MKCIYCGGAIPQARIEALSFLGIPMERATHVECSDVKPLRGLYQNETGSLIIVNNLGQDGIEKQTSLKEIEAI